MADLAARSSDPCSRSNPEIFAVKHCKLVLKVNFDLKIFKGFVEYRISYHGIPEEDFCLDAKTLNIHEVLVNGEKVKYVLDEPHKAYGSKLSIPITQACDKEAIVRIDYETRAESEALDWLDPLQTAGKKLPYVYSQCQAILARTMMPCQDTPSAKFPYSAEISVPKNLVALMGAIKRETFADPDDPAFEVNTFEQKVPISSYLMAVAVGAMESRVIGPRSKVWSEKEIVDAAAEEFSETEQMLQAAEDLLGPYIWEEYNLLVLPPSFSHGGMENPCLTFVTPTLVSGDKSLTTTVAHEISHSWTGNLVTNKCNEHFWLNEGNTVFMERKILGRLKGEAFRHFEAMNGWYKLKETVRDFGEGHRFASLLVDCTDIDPDDAFSKIPYEKGSAMLMYLEQQLGGPAVFEAFLRSYIEHFKYRCLTTAEWKDFLYQHFHDKKNILDKVDWNEWFYGRSMPPAQPKYDTTLADEVVSLSHNWSDFDGNNDTKFSASDMKDFSVYQKKGFLQQLLDQGKMTSEKLKKMDQIYRISGYKDNSEIRFRWHRLCIKARMSENIDSAFEFLRKNGRLAYHRPLSRDLYQWEEMRQRTIDHYLENKKYLNKVTAKYVAEDLHLN